MKNKLFINLTLVILTSLLTLNSQAQLLNKLKKKAENAVSKSPDKPAGNTDQAPTVNNTDTAKGTPVTNAANPTTPKTNGDSDFIPGSTVLYFDNFEKEKPGDSPAGWLTTSSAEVVGVEGLKGKWLKMAALSSTHITRNKKQSWSNSFTVEFDILIVKKEYDPRIDISLINTAGSLVTDEMILRNAKHSAYVSLILGDEGRKTRVGLAGNNNIYKSLVDRMSDQLIYSNTIPVHVSMCVQGKRFRCWWDDKKILDMEMIDQQYIPNQLGFYFGSVGGSDFYVTNIRVAKDIPATKPANPPANNNAVTTPDEAPANTNTKPASTAEAVTKVDLQSKILTVSLPYAQIMKTGEYSYTFMATKEEGNYKENYFKINLETGNTSLRAETFNFKEINQKNALYGTKKYPEIKTTEAVLFYGAAKKPYIYRFSPIIANGTMASYVDATLERHLPPVSASSKLVIEKMEDGKASGYFTMGIMIQGLKPVTKGDAMTETFTDGFSGELKCKFSN
ncbi:MAG TPA: hypothetical protein PLO99_04960, partial [Chitinophagaceae bacterium]|nr:hypothetical protein [Chitinophagaceae bacterium]